MQWRNWPLLVKLGMVLVVPVVGALVLGVLRVRDDVALADSYADTGRIATLRGELVPAISVIQRERSLAAMQARGGSPDFQAQTAETDSYLARMDRLIRQIPDLGAAASTGYENLRSAIASLGSVRENVTAGAHPWVLLNGYGRVINSMLEFDRTLIGRFPDEELSGTSSALNDLQAAREQVSLQQALGLIGLRRGQLVDVERQLFVEAGIRLEDKVAEFRTVAPADLARRYDATVTGPEVSTRRELSLAARVGGTIALPFSETQWNSLSNLTTERMDNVARNAAVQLQAGSTRLQDSIGNRAGTQSVLLLIMVLLAAGIGGVLGRYLLRSLGVLRRTALDVAANRLPAAVASIRAGEAAKVAIEPVPLRTTEEFGQLARAFDAVNGQAVRSAAEEASLRSNLRNIFVNLSRRSQGLVERQLRLMEQLEQKENDPDQLANLFRLDHLATRMRRNNENLMVLSGLDLGRRANEPMPLPDVLRAAVSEVEHYQRVVVRSAPTVWIVGYAAGDLIRSVAELVENATAFSPPATQVVITSVLREDGTVLIDIIDQGIGMGEVELREANQRVAAGGDVDVPVSRQMGLFVVGNLTNRHGILVHLGPREDGEAGLRASVLVLPNLVTREAPAASEPEDRALPEPPPTVAVPVQPVPEPVAVAAEQAVTGRLESAGIFVRLPTLPAATSPASILFAPRVPVEATAEFTWLGKPAPAPAPAPAAAATPAPAVHQQGPDGLPKRVPKAQLLATPMARPPSPVPRPAATRDAARTRGFLNSFQAGIRQRENSDKEGEGNE